MIPNPAPRVRILSGDLYTIRLRSLLRAYPSLHPSGVHWVPEQLNIKAVTGACKLIDGCSLALCSTTVSVVSTGICHRNKVNSIAWLYRKAQPKYSIIYMYINIRVSSSNLGRFSPSIRDPFSPPNFQPVEAPWIDVSFILKSSIKVSLLKFIRFVVGPCFLV